MIRGLYTAATGMLVQELKPENISNNLANVNTAGYKKSEVAISAFPEILLNQIDALKGGGKGVKPIGTFNNGAMLAEEKIDFSIGSLEETGSPLDLALGGKGFFTLATPQGISYSRNGAFHLDGAGYLVNSHGDYVLGLNGPIFIGTSNFTVSLDGSLMLNDEYVDTLLITTFNDESLLEKAGHDLYLAPQEAGPSPLDSTQVAVKQSYIEKPNLNMVNEMVNMLTVIRTYEANQKVIQAIDELLGKSVNEIGSIK